MKTTQHRIAEMVETGALLKIKILKEVNPVIIGTRYDGGVEGVGRKIETYSHRFTISEKIINPLMIKEVKSGFVHTGPFESIANSVFFKVEGPHYIFDKVQELGHTLDTYSLVMQEGKTYDNVIQGEVPDDLNG